MSGHDHKGFNANKIFLWLIIFTAVEIGWGYLGHQWHVGKLLLWGGLILFALLKGLLILSYFMHFRFEGWVIKGLIAPTPFLIVVILTVLSPDVACNHKLNHDIGSMYSPKAGDVVDLHEVAKNKGYGDNEADRASGGHGGGAGHAAAANPSDAHPADAHPADAHPADAHPAVGGGAKH